MRAQEGRAHQQWEQAAAQCSQLQGQVVALQHTLLSPEASTPNLHRTRHSRHYSPAGEAARNHCISQWESQQAAPFTGPNPASSIAHDAAHIPASCCR